MRVTALLALGGVRAASLLATVSLCASGCVSPLFLNYEGIHTACRIENSDGDNNWDPSDTNGNGQIDAEENFSPQVDFDQVRTEFAGIERTRGLQAGQNSQQAAGRTVISPGFPEDFSSSLSTTSLTGLLDFDSGFDIQPVEVVDDDSGNPVASIPTGFDDLVVPQTTVNAVGYRNSTRFRGLSLAKVARFRLGEKIPPNENAGDNEQRRVHQLIPVQHSLELSLGGRFSRLEDHNLIAFYGGAAEGLHARSNIDRTAIGPELGVTWSSSLNRWELQSSGSLLLGYQDDDMVQQVSYSPLISVLKNHPLYFSPIAPIGRGAEQTAFSSQANLGFQGRYKFANSASISLGYRALYLEDVRHAESIISWALPSLGIQEVAGEEVLIHTLYASFDFRH